MQENEEMKVEEEYNTSAARPKKKKKKKKKAVDPASEYGLDDPVMVIND